jgi:hypothetical protein
MEKIVKNGKEWFSIKDFMEKYGVRSNATVYNMVKDGRALMDRFMGKRIFSIK